MSKYTPNQQVCEAIYADIPGNNPLLAAMPDMLSPSQFKKAISNMPGLPHNLSQMSPEERQQSLALLSSVFVPMDYMYTLYSQLYRVQPTLQSHPGDLYCKDNLGRKPENERYLLQSDNAPSNCASCFWFHSGRPGNWKDFYHLPRFSNDAPGA